MKAYLDECESIAIKSKVVPVQTRDNQLEYIDRKELLSAGRRYWALRRGQDIILSLLGLLLLSPIILISALIIIIESPGAGPFFAQTRVGRNGKTFKFYKLRSMVPDAEKNLHTLMHLNEMDGPAFKIKDDPRITKFGKFIRKSSIDELPQLWNVLKGEMSIVGPRPSLPREAEQYNEYEQQRLYITPGLTCYWQTHDKRNDLSFKEWIDLDIKYMQERSFLVDWGIIFKTFRVVFKMDGV